MLLLGKVDYIEEKARKLIGKDKKLILAFNLEQGIIITKVHKIITFDKSDWLKKYIDFNTQQRSLAKTTFEKNIWKLMNNSFYGKTIENVKDRINFDFCTDDIELRKLINKPHFKGCKVFYENCIRYQLSQTNVVLKKPIYLGVSILELSKLLMYEFYYNKIEKLWPNTEIIGV